MNTGPVSHTPKVFDWADYTVKLNKLHQLAEVLDYDYSIRRSPKSNLIGEPDGFVWYAHGTKQDVADKSFCTRDYRDLDRVLDDAIQALESSLSNPAKETS